MSKVKDIHHLPLNFLGFGLTNIPAIPFDLEEALGTLVRLGLREEQAKQAMQGLTNTYRLGGFENTGYAYLFGTGETGNASARSKLTEKLEATTLKILPKVGQAALIAKDLVKDDDEEPVNANEPITALSIEDPAQLTMSWTTFPPVYRDAQPLLPGFKDSLLDPDAASRAFWPTIATYGLPYNLLILAKVDAARLSDLQALFGAAWTSPLDEAANAGLAYVLDLRFFENLKPQTVKGFTRFTPATVTVLIQDAATKALTPVLVRVSGFEGAGATVYSRPGASDSAWLYALQAAKTSVTVYGIWFGHVYHWHIPTAAMQMTLWNNVPEGHPLLQLLGPQSNYVIGFDGVLLLLWKSIAPPTSVSSAWQFLKITDTFAEGRSYFADDPPIAIDQLGLRQEDFTVNTPWDAYPLVGHLLEIWRATEEFVGVFIASHYANDTAVAEDEALQAWIKASGKSSDGNIQGLPEMNTRAALARVLISQVFRVTAHGSARLNHSANPGLTFIGNFPPCLQNSDIPPADVVLSTAELLAYLPKTGTMGEMMNFYNIFSFSTPYVPLIPLAGIDADPYFTGPAAPRCNAALVEYRRRLLRFIEAFDPDTLQRFQWPRNVET